MKKLIPIVLCVALIIGCFFACAPKKSDENISTVVVINEGDSIFKIASILEQEGIITNSPGFITKVIITGDRSKLKYGKFLVSSNMEYADLIETLSGSGISEEVTTITIPEGYSVQQIAEMLGKSDVRVTEVEFYEALKDDYNYDFIKNIPDVPGRDYKLQGFLFPSTYEVYVDSDAHDIINILLGEFEKQYQAAGDNNSGLSFYDAMIMASLVQREGLLKSELPIIAGVIKNRIEQDMILQIDATVAYAITNGKYTVNMVTYDDLETDSPYNTYKYPGLPAGPICNPGAEAIKGALNPAEHEYLYYHTDEIKKDGSHIFTKTYEEHKNTMN